jgi:hypothetical protein
MGDGAEKVVEAATLALVAASAGSTGTSPAVAVGVALAPTVASGVVRLALLANTKRVQRKLDAWFNEVGINMSLGNTKAAAEEISEHIDEKWAHEAVVHAVRTMLGDIDEACIPALARLTTQSFVSKTPPDDRARRAAALLVDLTPRTFDALRALVHLSAGLFRDDVTHLEAHIVPESMRSASMLASSRVDIVSPDVTAGAITLTRIDTGQNLSDVKCNYGATFDVFRLLRAHMFATEMGPQIVALNSTDVLYLGTIVL